MAAARPKRTNLFCPAPAHMGQQTYRGQRAAAACAWRPIGPSLPQALGLRQKTNNGR
jgi:hypothetical protein